LWDVAIFAEQIPQEFLNIFGWTKQEYENEILKRVDKEFTTLLNASCLSN